MNIAQRFISYTTIDTTSSPEAATVPSTPNQKVLAGLLVDQLGQIGLRDATMDDNGFVYASLPSNSGNPDDPTVGFLAHMDTSDATSGKDIKARIIDNYDGQDIVLSPGIETKVADYPFLKELKGKQLIVTDGTTLLGGDDKAGIAIIMEMLVKFSQHQELLHPNLVICFSPDEEIGSGMSHVDLKKLNVDYAYTLDGGAIDEISYENFNAASARLLFKGNSIHPGSAKGKMINALQLAIDFHNMLPVFDRPEFTEKREGFNHLLGLKGSCQQAEAFYILRNHDLKLLQKQKDDFSSIAALLNRRYGFEVVELKLIDSYYNMIEGFEGKMFIVDDVKKAYANLNMPVREDPIRGGTDGAWLTAQGIPTPNLATGGYNCHGNHELVAVDDMAKMADVLVELNAVICRRQEAK